LLVCDVNHYVIIRNVLQSIFNTQGLDIIMETLQIPYTFQYYYCDMTNESRNSSFARQRIGKQVPAETNTYATIEEPVDTHQ
jgi:hypothetical protein